MTRNAHFRGCTLERRDTASSLLDTLQYHTYCSFFLMKYGYCIVIGSYQVGWEGSRTRRSCLRSQSDHRNAATTECTVDQLYTGISQTLPNIELKTYNGSNVHVRVCCQKDFETRWQTRLTTILLVAVAVAVEDAVTPMFIGKTHKPPQLVDRR